jgi:hypothetical protein
VTFQNLKVVKITQMVGRHIAVNCVSGLTSVLEKFGIKMEILLNYFQVGLQWQGVVMAMTDLQFS